MRIGAKPCAESRGVEVNVRHQTSEYEVNRAMSLLISDESYLLEFYHEAVSQFSVEQEGSPT